MSLEGIIILWLICAIIAALIDRSRGRHPIGGFMAGAVFGPLGVIFVLFSKADAVGLEQAQLDQGMKKCPYCAEMVKRDAIVCRYCGRDLPTSTPV